MIEFKPRILGWMVIGYIIVSPGPHRSIIENLKGPSWGSNAGAVLDCMIFL